MAFLLRRRRLLVKSSHVQMFLQLPSTYRSFHASPTSQFLDSTLSTTQTLLETLHSTTGLPWFYAIPLSAVCLRLSIMLPIGIYARRKQQQQMALMPLVSAWQQIIRKETMAEVGHLGPTISQSAGLKGIRLKRQEIFKRFKCQIWKTVIPPIIQLPFWMIMVETVRRMCGANLGLLGLAFNSNFGIEDGLKEGLHRVESLATEGALWFPNLLVPDPQLVLPFMLSGLIFLNLSSKSDLKISGWHTRLTQVFKIVALGIGPATLNLPSAVLLYWISTTSLALIQGRILNTIMPLKPPVESFKEKRSRLLAPTDQKDTKNKTE